MPGVTHTPHDFTTADGVCHAHVFTPDTPGPWPAVLVFMDGIGIRPTLFDHCARLAAAGYVVLLPDLFYRSGPYDPVDPAKLLSDPAVRGAWFARHAPTTNSANIMRDTAVFLDFLRDERVRRQGRDDDAALRVGVVGYCMGGRMAMIAAGTYPDRIAAAAAYHPANLADANPDSPHLLAANIQARVYVAAATDDASFPDEQKLRFTEALTAAGVDHTLETYPARHGWVFRDIPVHDVACSERHWDSLLALFAGTLRG